MDIIFRCCAGLDIHKKTVEVCVRRKDPQGRVHEQTRRFGTMTRQILALSDWLSVQGVTHVVMESTGVFWKPIWNLLEGQFELLLVNAQHVKQVPGRKTDATDAQWLAQLLQYGLLRSSFVPPREIRELRDLTRHRTQLVSEKSRVANRIQKTLEDANIKLAAVATDVLGVSGRQMIEALIGGEQDAEKMADLAQRKLRAKIPQLRLALQGRVSEHHRFMLQVLWEQLTYVEQLIERLNQRIQERMRPYEDQIKRLIEVPGIHRVVAQVLVPSSALTA